MSDELLDLPEQARKIRDRESAHLGESARAAAARASGPGPALTGLAELLSQRRRYMGMVGEHYSVQDPEGIKVVDHLDEALLRHVHGHVHGFLRSSGTSPSETARSAAAGRLDPHVQNLPQFPVAFAVLYVLRKMFESFEDLLDARPGDRPEELELALLHRVRDVTARYLDTRDRPLQRHFSDVEREYSVVTRLKCPCGEEKYRVAMQSLQTSSDGRPYDRLEIQCASCGARRCVSFELPHFQDLYQM